MKGEKSYTVVLADDHLMFRHLLKQFIQNLNYAKVVGEAGDGLQLLELVKQIKPDLAIVDISMPKLKGLEATKEIKMKAPEVKVLILTMHKEKEYLFNALALGAEGYLLKEDSEAELSTAIDTIRNGGVYISPILSTYFKDIVLERQRLRQEKAKSSK